MLIIVMILNILITIIHLSNNEVRLIRIILIIIIEAGQQNSYRGFLVQMLQTTYRFKFFFFLKIKIHDNSTLLDASSYNHII